MHQKQLSVLISGDLPASISFAYFAVEIGFCSPAHTRLFQSAQWLHEPLQKLRGPDAIADKSQWTFKSQLVSVVSAIHNITHQQLLQCNQLFDSLGLRGHGTSVELLSKDMLLSPRSRPTTRSRKESMDRNHPTDGHEERIRNARHPRTISNTSRPRPAQRT